MKRKTLEQRALIAQRKITDRHRIYAPSTCETPTVIREGWHAGYAAGRRDELKRFERLEAFEICEHGIENPAECAVCTGLRTS